MASAASSPARRVPTWTAPPFATPLVLDPLAMVALAGGIAGTAAVAHLARQLTRIRRGRHHGHANMTRTTDLEASLADVRWLRDLAQTLVRDAHRAEDLAQDTWVAALRQGLDRIADLRGWLTTALRNNARQMWRSESRAAARTAALPLPGTGAGSDMLVANLQEQRLLLAAVEDLGEPSRSAILLRYSEGLTPRAIARRLGIPVATVQTRLKRGLARLRERLDSCHGSRAAWLAVLAPWSRSTPTLAPLCGGLLLMHSQLKLGLLAAVVVGAVSLFAWSQLAPELAPSATAPVVEPARPAIAGTADAPATPVERQRVAVAPTAPPANATTAAADQRLAKGRAVQLDGAPLPNLTIARRGGDERTTTAADGTFTLPLRSQGGELEIVDAEWTTLFYGEATAGEAVERVVVGVRRQALRGRVVDEDGKPVADAQARIWLPASLRALLPMVLDYSGPRWWDTHSDAAGRFALDDCAQIPGVDLQVSKAGHRPARHPLAAGMQDIVITLARPAPGAGTVTGCVLDARGALVAGAHVAAGRTSTVSDERGEFVLQRSAIPAGAELVAVAKGKLPGKAPVPKEANYVVIQLGGDARQLTGIVVDHTGAPLPGCKVWVADPTYFGNVDELMVTAEGMTGSGRDRTEVDRVLAATSQLTDQERNARLPPDRTWDFCRTDADGAFRIEGLADRQYRVRASAERTLLQADFGPFPAGATGLRLQMPTDRVCATVAGHVVDTAGQPVGDARVRVRTEVLRIGNEGSWVVRGQTRDPVRADAAGAFTLHDVPRGCRLRVEGDSFETTEVLFGAADGSADPRQDPASLRIVVARLCHFRVELGDPARADAIAMLDAAGAAMDLVRIEGTSRYSGERQELHAGRSPVLNVLEGARTLVLYKTDAVVARIEVALRPGEVTVLSP